MSKSLGNDMTIRGVVDSWGREVALMLLLSGQWRKPLDFNPGSKHVYSNFGYCLLGRVIEKVTGKAYDEYVKEQVLAPLGIRSMRLGKTHLEDRQDGEVRYYSPEKGRSVFAAGN